MTAESRKTCLHREIGGVDSGNPHSYRQSVDNKEVNAAHG